MATTPPTEAFLREVDEELRREQALTIWKRYGRWIIAAVIGALAAFAAYLWWSNDRETKAGVEGEQLSAVIDDLSGGKTDGLDPKLDTLAGSSHPGVSVAARMTHADLLLIKNDAKGAAAAFGKIVADTGLAQPYRDAALVRQTAAEYDTLAPDTVVARLKPLAIPGNSWFGTAGEMVGIAYLRQGNLTLARAMFAAMLKDKAVPETIRSRVVQLASSIGVEATALPGNTNKGAQ